MYSLGGDVSQGVDSRGGDDSCRVDSRGTEVGSTRDRRRGQRRSLRKRAMTGVDPALGGSAARDAGSAPRRAAGPGVPPAADHDEGRGGGRSSVGAAAPRARLAPPPSPGDSRQDCDDIIVGILGAGTPGARQYVELLRTTGITHGLVGPREADRLWDRHVLNCAVVQELLPKGARVIDIGSGAGLPGIVLAIVRPDLEVTLVEPLERRVRWLGETIADLGLDNVSLVRARAESLHDGLRAPFVTARAVAPLGRLAALCLPLVESGGALLALKGASAGREVQRDAAAIRAAGGRSPAIHVLGEGRLATPTTVVEIGVARSPMGSTEA